MKCRILMAIIGLVACFSQNVMAQEGAIKERLTAEYLNFIKEEGYIPTIDSDGDIKFKVEGDTHYVIVYDEESPQYVNFMRYGFSIGGDNGLDQTKSLIAANNTNKNIRAAKATVSDSAVWFTVGMAYPDIDTFKKVFYKIISYLDSSYDNFIEEYTGLNRNN